MKASEGQIIYGEFVEGRLEARKHLVRGVFDLEPKYEELRPLGSPRA